MQFCYSDTNCNCFSPMTKPGSAILWRLWQKRSQEKARFWHTGVTIMTKRSHQMRAQWPVIFHHWPKNRWIVLVTGWSQGVIRACISSLSEKLKFVLVYPRQWKQTQSFRQRLFVTPYLALNVHGPFTYRVFGCAYIVLQINILEIDAAVL